MKHACLFFVVVAIVVQISQQDSCHLRELDLCAATALLGLRETPVAQNEEQIDAQCVLANEAVECISNFTNRCCTPLHRQLISLVTESPRTTLKEYCTPGTELRSAAVQFGSCLSEAWEEGRGTCIIDAQAALEAVGDAPFDQQLDMLCCTYQRYRQCCAAITRTKCGDEGEEFLQRTIGLIASNLPDLVCSNCDGEDKCEGLLPATGTTPKGAESKFILSQLLSMYLN